MYYTKSGRREKADGTPVHRIISVPGPELSECLSIPLSVCFLPSRSPTRKLFAEDGYRVGTNTKSRVREREGNRVLREGGLRRVGGEGSPRSVYSGIGTSEGTGGIYVSMEKGKR